MTLPAVLFGLLVSSFLGVAAHLIFGGSPSKLLALVVLAWIGFWGGHFVAESLGWTFLSVGPLRLGLGVLVSLVLLPIGHWLSLVRVVKTEK